MERAGLARVDDDRCSNLRWKGMFIPAEWDKTIQYCNDRSFWCQKTQIPLGPDGQLVDDFECHEGRNCFKALLVNLSDGRRRNVSPVFSGGREMRGASFSGRTTHVIFPSRSSSRLSTIW